MSPFAKKGLKNRNWGGMTPTYTVQYFNGWIKGIYILSLSNFRRKLNILEGKIHAEVTKNGSLKTIATYKNSRERIMQRYTKVSNKLKELNNG